MCRIFVIAPEGESERECNIALSGIENKIYGEWLPLLLRRVGALLNLNFNLIIFTYLLVVLVVSVLERQF